MLKKAVNFVKDSDAVAVCGCEILLLPENNLETLKKDFWKQTSKKSY